MYIALMNLDKSSNNFKPYLKSPSSLFRFLQFLEYMSATIQTLFLPFTNFTGCWTKISEKFRMVSILITTGEQSRNYFKLYWNSLSPLARYLRGFKYIKFLKFLFLIILTEWPTFCTLSHTSTIFYFLAKIVDGGYNNWILKIRAKFQKFIISGKRFTSPHVETLKVEVTLF